MADFDAESVLAENGGELEPTWFLGLTRDRVLERLSGFAAKVPAGVAAIGDEEDHDYAVTVWVYAQAYQWLEITWAQRAGSIDIPNDVSKSTDETPAKTFARLAASKLAEFLGLVPGGPAAPNAIQTVSFTANFRP